MWRTGDEDVWEGMWRLTRTKDREAKLILRGRCAGRGVEAVKEGGGGSRIYIEGALKGFECFARVMKIYPKSPSPKPD